MSLKHDYIDSPFSGKKDQFDQVLDALDSTGFIPESLLESEAKWFYESLGIDDVFFARLTPEEIAGHIHALYSCKVQAYANAGEQPLISYKREAEDHACPLAGCTGLPGATAQIGITRAAPPQTHPSGRRISQSPSERRALRRTREGNHVAEVSHR